MQKIMSLPVYLGIFLAGIVMIPVAFAGCGPGTVLVDGVCELAPTPESSTACGPGTTLVDEVCELDETTKQSSIICPIKRKDRRMAVFHIFRIKNIYFATFTDRVSLITVTFTWPGYVMSVCIFCEISKDSWAALSSLTFSLSTMTLSSRPA